VAGLKSWIALNFKKWGLEPSSSSLTEIYAYGSVSSSVGRAAEHSL